MCQGTVKELIREALPRVATSNVSIVRVMDNGTLTTERKENYSTFPLTSYIFLVKLFYNFSIGGGNRCYVTPLLWRGFCLEKILSFN